MDGYGHIMERLDRPKRQGGRVRAYCPVHGGDRQRSLVLWVGEGGQLVARCWACGCSFQEIARALGTTTADWFPPRDRKERKKVPDRVIARYPFHDRDGNLLCEEVRLRPFPNQGKRVRYRRPMPGGEWAWSLQEGVYRRRPDGWKYMEGVVELADGDLLLERVEPVPYRLPELLKAQAIVVVEGPKDADTLRRLGFTATAAPCGARNWPPHLGRYFRGKRVCVLPDADAAGALYAQAVLGSLLMYGAASIRVAQIPPLQALRGAKDATDLVEGPWGGLTHLGRQAAFRKLFRAAPEWGVLPPASSDTMKVVGNNGRGSREATTVASS